jgi:hypothetical protein
LSEENETIDSQTVIDDMRKFWHEMARDVVKNSPTAIEETAKQLIAIAGILGGLYFHAITFGDERSLDRGKEEI